MKCQTPPEKAYVGEVHAQFLKREGVKEMAALFERHKERFEYARRQTLKIASDKSG